MVKTIKGAPAAGASIDAPAGIHFMPAASATNSTGGQQLIPMFKNADGEPDRCVLVGATSASSIAVIEYKRLGNSWVFDPADCARDSSVFTTFSTASAIDITFFAIDGPAGSGDRVLFIVQNNGGATPDTFEIDSVVLIPGGTSLTKTSVTISGANQPPDINNVVVVTIPLTVSRVMTIHQDDAHFGDITVDAGTYTFDYGDSTVTAIDTSISPIDNRYSGICIGSQVCLLKAGADPNSSILWEMTTSAVLTEEFNTFAAGGMGSQQDVALGGRSRLTGIGGSFAIASPYGGSDASGEEMAYVISTFPLDDI